MPARRRNTLALAALLAVVLAWWCSGFVVVRGLSLRQQPPYAESLPPNPRLVASEHDLATPGGETFGAWWFPAPADGAAAVLLLHANGGSRSAMIKRATQLQRRGHSVLVPTLHAHGDASGALNDFGFTARHQVPVCLDLMRTLAPERTAVIDGLSLGAAAALFAAAETASDGGAHPVAGYILEAPYLDLAAAAHNRLRMQLPDFAVPIAYAAMRAAAPLYFDPDDISPKRALTEVPRGLPILFIVGSEDEHAPPEQVRELAETHGANARLLVVEGAGHDDLSWAQPDLYWAAIDELIEAAVAVDPTLGR